MRRRCILTRKWCVVFMSVHIFVCFFLYSWVKQTIQNSSQQIVYANKDIIRQYISDDNETVSSTTGQFHSLSPKFTDPVLHNQTGGFIKENQNVLEPSDGQGIAVFNGYLERKVSLCDKELHVYDGKVASLRNVILDKSKATAKAKGGEDPLQILKQYSDKDEMYTYQPGTFLQPCDVTNPPFPAFPSNGMHLLEWQRAMKGITPDHDVYHKQINRTGNFTIAIARYEYANLYWTIMDLYDVFLVMKFFRRAPSETTVLIIDAHPGSHLDPLWYHVFGNVYRLNEMPELTQFDHLVWGMSRGSSPLLVKQSVPPLIKEFKETVWARLKIPPKKPIKCSPKPQLDILLVWRHNYVAHPRNPSGEVARKIANENELLSHIQSTFNHSHAQGVQLDSLSIPQQVALIANTDIFVGMHGAAFAYALLLPQPSVVIEMFPMGFSANWHMEYLAKWNGLKYTKWKNTNSALEKKSQKMTTIPLSTAAGLIGDAQNYLCPSKTKR